MASMAKKLASKALEKEANAKRLAAIKAKKVALAQPKNTKKHPSQLDWSDDESEYKIELAISKKNIPIIQNEDKTYQCKIIEPTNKLPEYKRSKGFKGDVKVNKPKLDLLEKEKKDIESKKIDYGFRLPLPYIPSHITQVLTERTICLIWEEFLENGADESEMVLYKYIKEMTPRIIKRNGKKYIPFNKLDYDKDDENFNDYVEFRELIEKLAKLTLIQPIQPTFQDRPKMPLCCTLTSCRRSKRIARYDFPSPNVTPSKLKSSSSVSMEDSFCGSIPDKKIKSMEEVFKEESIAKSIADQIKLDAKGSDDDDDDEEVSEFNNTEHDENNHCLSILYNKIKIEHNGIVRIRNLFDIMKRAVITYDKNRLPQKFWDLKSDFFIESIHQLGELVETIRTDLDEERRLDASDLYRLPAWLLNEFKPSEIMLFKHHFIHIDADGGGSIDKEELIELTASLGAKVTPEVAQDLIDAYDLDRSGTIDFAEFMMLLFKIEHGTISLEDNVLAQSIIEAKSQITIFEEIEEMMRSPPKFCTVNNYGGNPVECNYNIQGPPGSLYEGGLFKVRVTFLDGYPFRPPICVFSNRIFNPNFMTLYDGTSCLPHLQRVWNNSWNMKKLLEHIVSLLIKPDLSFVEERLLYIAKCYAWTKEEERRERDGAAEAEEKAAAEEQASRYSNMMDTLMGEGFSKSQQEKSEKENNNENNNEYKNDYTSENKNDDNILAIAESTNGQIAGAKDENATLHEDSIITGGEYGENEEEEEEEEEDPHTRDAEKYGFIDYESLIEVLPRLDQMYINVIGLFLLHNPDRYNDVVKSYVREFALPELDEEEEYKPVVITKDPWANKMDGTSVHENEQEDALWSGSDDEYENREKTVDEMLAEDEFSDDEEVALGNDQSFQLCSIDFSSPTLMSLRSKTSKEEEKTLIEMKKEAERQIWMEQQEIKERKERKLLQKKQKKATLDLDSDIEEEEPY